ncbi:unnamed protein product [Cochlearia groenlandica]
MCVSDNQILREKKIKNLLWLFVGFAVCFVAVLGLGFYLVKKARRARGSLSEPTTHHEQPESCDGTSVAVKRMFPSGRGSDQLKSEVNILSKVQHRNLVILYGYCVEGSERILVYQYMPQDTLSRHLFHWKDQGLRPLGWSTRVSIVLNVARKLSIYTHWLVITRDIFIGI